MKFLCQAVQKLQSEQMDTQIDRHTDTQTDTTENITYPHTRVVIIVDYLRRWEHVPSEQNSLLTLRILVYL